MNDLGIQGLADADRDLLVYMAKVAETAERYDDMRTCMRFVVEKFNSTESQLTVEERNLLSVAYKNVVGARRASWRTLTMDEVFPFPDEVEEYKTLVKGELEDVCGDILRLLESSLIPAAQAVKDQNADNLEPLVFYLKMAGDYYRYLAELSREGNANNAMKFYKEALEIAQGPSVSGDSNSDDALAPTHPIRLGLVLNFSVHLYEIMDDPGQACDIAKNAFDLAVQKLEFIDEAQYKDSTLIMQLLRDNLTLWTQENDDN